MKIPDNYTQEEVVNILLKICKRLAPKYVFAFYEKEDIEQEAFLIGVEGLDNYDGERRLTTFLYYHISNRLKTFKRDNFYRVTEGKARTIQETKRKIHSPSPYCEDLMVDDSLDSEINYNDIVAIIDEKLPPEYRSDYLRLINGQKIPDTRKDKIKELIREIIDDEEYEL